MKIRFHAKLASITLLALAASAMADQDRDQDGKRGYRSPVGPSTQTAPYLQAIAPKVKITSILTTGDVVQGYKMGGIPDGLGAYDNDDGTFTVLMNHEIAGTLGAVRAHGDRGAYVSEWVINKKTLAVVSGADLMKKVWQKATNGSWVPVPNVGTLGQTTAFSRFCSADLADRSAFFNNRTRNGTQQRIFLNGEEAAPTFQRGVAHVATGPNKGNSYVLPWASDANAAWETLVANPRTGEKTVVIGNADGGTNGIYVYVGTKSNVGNDVEKAGLVGGNLYRVAVNNTNVPETRAADAGLGLVPNSRGNYAGSFNLVTGPDVTNSISTRFQRPEDGAWDKKDQNRFYFVTTDQMDAAKDGNINTDIAAGQVGRSRLWALTFKDASKPELGGGIEMLLDGTSAKGDYQMFDNMTVNDDGTLILQEDVGRNQHNGKIWKYDPKSGSMTKLAGFDPLLFGDIGVVGTITKDEESSGVIDITKILDRDDDDVTYNLFVSQSHTPSGDVETVEGGQLLLMRTQRGNKDKDKDKDED